MSADQEVNLDMNSHSVQMLLPPQNQNRKTSFENTEDGGESLGASGFNLSNSQMSQFKHSNLTNHQFTLSNQKEKKPQLYQ